jgi:hypothetical protein
MRYILIFLLLWQYNAQAKKLVLNPCQIRVSAIRPAFPLTKFYGVIGDGPIHPMLEVGTSFNWNQSPKNCFFQSINMGFAYHRFLQSMLPIYSDLNYMRMISFKKQKIGAGLSLGAGYLHSFPLTDQFKMVNGVYEQVGRMGRSQAMLKVGAFIRFKQFTFGYNNIIQTPFVKSYVPLMPYNCLSLSYTFNSNSCISPTKKSTDATK